MASAYVGYAFLLVLLSSIIITYPAFAKTPTNQTITNQTAVHSLPNYNVPPLSVRTDSDSYKQGDTIVITGLVKHPEQGVPVTLRILDSIQNLIGIDQISPSEDGSFTAKHIATGPLWKSAGNYTIIVQYGKAQRAETKFAFSGGTGSTDINPVEEKVFKVNAGEQGTFDVSYIIKGGSVKNMEIFSDKLTLRITIDAKSDGSLTVKLPRDLIDAKVQVELSPDEVLAGKTINPKELEDDKFIVMVGNGEAPFKETKDKNSRTLSIGFVAGDTTIDIVGTHIVPEFGAIAALVLAIAIISIIAVSAKTRLRLMPKY